MIPRLVLLCALLVATSDATAIDRAISGGPHRDGQALRGGRPTNARLREDLRLIRDDDLDLRVMRGIWVDPITPRGVPLSVFAEIRGAEAAAERNGKTTVEAMPWVDETAGAVQSAQPDLLVVLGEVGGAANEHDADEQAELIAGIPTQDEQVRFVRELDAWTERERVMTFFFEAFDEIWKGGDHPDHAAKHRGLYRADRTPKPAMRAVAESRKDRP